MGSDSSGADSTGTAVLYRLYRRVPQASFQQAAASDEKTDLVARFLAHLSDELLRDADWQAADDHQLHLAREAIEQMVMAQVGAAGPGAGG